MPLPNFRNLDANPIEPMQIDLPENEGGAPEENFVVEFPTLDLDVYASSYKGVTKLQRLLFIANHCPSLAADAMRLASSAVKSTHNLDMYKEIARKLAEVSNQGSAESAAEGQGYASGLDQSWIDTTEKKAQTKLEKLSTDLKYYKTNSIKESIRRGNDDLGDHYLDCGNLTNALKCYSRARDYCVSAKHTMNMCLNVIKVSIFLPNWAHVQTYVNKAELIPDLNEKEKPYNQGFLSKLKCAAGLAELAKKSYKAAARLFLQASFDNLDFSEVVSAHDVAIYGGLCSLATFDRQDLQKKVLSSSSFKQFLELEPQLRNILHKFYDSQYAECLKLLGEMKDNLLLDIYLSPHVNTLYSEIRKRALIQYFSPYVSADLNKMAEAFNTSISLLEDELTQLILDGQISARIDSQKKILYARDIDQRSSTFEKALSMGHEYQRRCKALILRTVLVRHQINVKSPVRDDDGVAR
ncbi:COP9 signalosome complex subunit 1-like isoform X2 [Rhopilema esculentum]|uniref:COP9 signalosome complex subunit 1-like isoform X2 n=1 Tax=Rhopilema esculentum TaxID=499914 RepID=UPI0031DE5F20